MKHGLLLPGYACKSWIWEEVQNELKAICELEVFDWPTTLTSDFNSINDFARWVRERMVNSNKTYDFMIGHSMGGLVALNVVKMGTDLIEKTVLVETFITSPRSFFQNLMIEGTSTELVEKVSCMMKEEQKYYSEQLKYQLRELDLTDLVTNLNCEVVALHGDRGCNDYATVLSNLRWCNDLQLKVNMDIISNSCHFPMLENPKELINILKKTLI